VVRRWKRNKRNKLTEMGMSIWAGWMLLEGVMA